MTRDPKTMAAAGFLAGALLGAVKDLAEVLPVTTPTGDYTGEVRYCFAGTWYTVTPRLVEEAGDA